MDLQAVKVENFFAYKLFVYFLSIEIAIFINKIEQYLY